MRFPIRQADILALAKSVACGLTAHADVFAAPPVLPAALSTDIDTLINAICAVTAAEAQLEAAINAKDAVLGRLADNIKKDLRYAENITDFSNEKLTLLGWSARKAKHRLAAPGQPQNLVFKQSLSGAPVLLWDQPPEGGKAAMYRIFRRSRAGTLPDGSNGSWREVASSLTTKTSLKDQPTGYRLEFAIRAVNRAGQSIESNTVEITL